MHDLMATNRFWSFSLFKYLYAELYPLSSLVVVDDMKHALLPKLSLALVRLTLRGSRVFEEEKYCSQRISRVHLLSKIAFL